METGKRTPRQRQRDAERTRRRLLQAASAEFAEKGRSGARVSSIAARAGVNAQLISYYFGGKDGLYEAILEQWAGEERELVDPGGTLGDLVAGFLAPGRAQPDRQRVLVRAQIDQAAARARHDPDAPEVAELRRRQAAGEIAADLDPAFLVLVLQAAVTVPTVFPADVRRLLGLEPASAAYYELAEEQLRRIVAHLAG